MCPISPEFSSLKPPRHLKIFEILHGTYFICQISPSRFVILLQSKTNRIAVLSNKSTLETGKGEVQAQNFPEVLRG
jgi:hypothetical protein